MNKKKLIVKLNPLLLNGIAHRGLHNEKFTENGMKAFNNAIEHNLPIELDIHLTKDNQLVVCHDEDLKRTTGKSGIIEDLTLIDIKRDYKLLDGGEVPTLLEVLDLIQERVPLVIELKVFRKNYKPLAQKLMQVLRDRVKDKSNYMLISFDPRSLWPFKRFGIVRSLLIAKSHLYVYNYFRFTIESIDIEKVLLKEKRIQRFCKKRFTNAWTIESEQDIDDILSYVDTVTFQHMDEKIVVNKLQEKRKLLN